MVQLQLELADALGGAGFYDDAARRIEQVIEALEQAGPAKVNCGFTSAGLRSTGKGRADERRGDTEPTRRYESGWRRRRRAIPTSAPPTRRWSTWPSRAGPRRRLRPADRGHGPRPFEPRVRGGDSRRPALAGSGLGRGTVPPRASGWTCTDRKSIACSRRVAPTAASVPWSGSTRCAGRTAPSSASRL